MVAYFGYLAGTGVGILVYLLIVLEVLAITMVNLYEGNVGGDDG
ncbi:hypothetical protein [Alicyclobacillus herbarius]|nr:hypothetical protein [Alicyclobacillus herbarius]